MSELTPAGLLWAGLIATTFATGLFWVFRAQKLTRLSPTRHFGCYFFTDPFRPQTDLAGFVSILVVGTALFPWFYAALLGTVLPVAGWSGAVAGTLHGLIAGALLPLAARANRCIRAEVIDGPGWYGIRLGRGTPVAIVLSHTVYGFLLGLILPALG